MPEFDNVEHDKSASMQLQHIIFHYWDTAEDGSRPTRLLGGTEIQGVCTSKSSALAWQLFGLVGWLMAMFYHLNSVDVHVRARTWDAVSTMLSILCSVLLYGSMSRTGMDIFQSNRDNTPDVLSISVKVAAACLIYIITQALLYKFRRHMHAFHVTVAFGAHLTAFAWIDAIHDAVWVHPFRDGAIWTFLGGIGALVVVLLTRFVNYYLRSVVIVPHIPPHFQEAWLEGSREMEDEIQELTMGLLFSLVIQQAIVKDDFFTSDGKPERISVGLLCSLAGVILLLASGVVVSRILFNKCVIQHLRKQAHVRGATLKWKTRAQMVRNLSMRSSGIETGHGLSDFEYQVERVVNVVVKTVALTMGFLFLYFGDCLFQHINDHAKKGFEDAMAINMIMALAFSAGVLIILRVVDCISDCYTGDLAEGLRMLNYAAAILMGLAWEETFHEGIHIICADYPVPQSTLIDNALTFAINLLVLPAWALYILPQVNASRAYEGGHAHAQNLVQVAAHQGGEHADGTESAPLGSAQPVQRELHSAPPFYEIELKGLPSI